jgi:hypothetical protein
MLDFFMREMLYYCNLFLLLAFLRFRFAFLMIKFTIIGCLFCCKAVHVIIATVPDVYLF